MFRPSELAELAVAYCDATMIASCDNREEDRMHRELNGSQWRLPTVGDFRDRREIDMPDHLRHRYRDPAKNVARQIWRGGFAERYRIGNCGELSDVAFRWLVEEQGAPGVARYSLALNNESIHAFVMIGIPISPPKVSVLKLEIPPAGWLPNCAWCDPWRREWFFIKDDWERNARMILKDVLQDYDVEPKDLNTIEFALLCRAYHAGTPERIAEA